MDKEYPFIAEDRGDELVWEKCALCDKDAEMGHEGKGYCGQHFAEVMGWATPSMGEETIPALDFTTIATIQKNGEVCCQTCGSWTTMEDMTDGKCPACREVDVTVAEMEIA